MSVKRHGERFTFDYPKNHQPVSVAAIPFSQLTEQMKVEEKRPWCRDRRWNNEPIYPYDYLHERRNGDAE